MSLVDPDRQQLLLELQKGRDLLAGALAGIDECLAGKTPSAGRWSILDCVEHIVVSEQLMLGRLRIAAPSDSAIGSPAREVALAARARDRRRAAESPEDARPKGRIHTLAEASAAFEAARSATLQWVSEFDHDLRAWVTDHPAVPGGVSCYEVLLLIAVHPQRHASQIDEIRRALERTAAVAHGSGAMADSGTARQPTESG